MTKVQQEWCGPRGLVYDLVSFAPRQTFQYAGEGWGLPHDQRERILGDGSEYLRFLDPGTFRETRRLVVTDAGVPIRQLNELEYVGGESYANIRHSDRIARTSARRGR